MASDITNTYRDTLYVKFANCIGNAAANGKLEATDLSVVCRQILTVMDTMKTTDQLVIFLKKMSAEWEFFNDLLSEISHMEKTVQNIEKVFYGRSRQD